MRAGPTLLSTCARAATAEEAAFRVQRPNSKARASRIVALDERAAEIMREVSGEEWQGARFFTYVETRAEPELEDLPYDAVLRGDGGAQTMLSHELESADVVVMIATSRDSAKAASVVGNACFVRSIMGAGLIVAPASPEVRETVKALRPCCSVLVVASGAEYVPEMLTALRA